jgi:hypothetical protein
VLHHARAAVALCVGCARTAHATVGDGGCRIAVVVGWALEPLAAVQRAAAVLIHVALRLADHRFGAGVAFRVAPARSAVVRVSRTCSVAHGVRGADVAITVAQGRSAAMRITGTGGIALGALGTSVAIVRARSRHAMPIFSAHLRVATGLRRARGRANQSWSHALAGHLRAGHTDRIVGAVGVHHARRRGRKASAAQPFPAWRIRLAKPAVGAVELPATRWVRATGWRRAGAHGHDAVDAAATAAARASTRGASALGASTLPASRSSARRARAAPRCAPAAGFVRRIAVAGTTNAAARREREHQEPYDNLCQRSGDQDRPVRLSGQMRALSKHELTLSTPDANGAASRA